ncbi:MAG: hypothetical protein KKE20_01010, partial [Nanoarchaeota archaeon]|nr:hypothetical protein [Nanoarchaeota archaeon]
NGIVTLSSAEGSEVSIDGNTYLLTGDVTLTGDGIFECTSGLVCSVSGNDITVRTISDGNPIEVHLTGEPAAVSFDTNGLITRMQGTLTLNLGLDYIFRGVDLEDPSTEYILRGSESVIVDFADGKFNSIDTDNQLELFYGNDDRTLSMLTLLEGGSASFAGSNSVNVDECNYRCSYANFDESRMNGLDIPDEFEFMRSHIGISANENGKFSFDSRDGLTEAIIQGENTHISIVDGYGEPLAGTTVTEKDGKVVSIFGNVDGNPLESEEGNPYGTYIKSYMNVDGELENLAHFVAADDIKGYNINGDFEINVGNDRMILMEEGTLGELRLDEDDKYPKASLEWWESPYILRNKELAVLDIGGTDVTIKSKGFTGDMMIDYPRMDEFRDDRFSIKTENYDGEGELLYSDNGRTMLLRVHDDPNDPDMPIPDDFMFSGGYFREVLDDLSDEEVVQMMLDQGFSRTDIVDLAFDRGRYYFFDKIQREMIMEGSLGQNREVPEDDAEENNPILNVIYDLQPEEEKDKKPEPEYDFDPYSVSYEEEGIYKPEATPYEQASLGVEHREGSWKRKWRPSALYGREYFYECISDNCCVNIGLTDTDCGYNRGDRFSSDYANDFEKVS